MRYFISNSVPVIYVFMHHFKSPNIMQSFHNNTFTFSPFAWKHDMSRIILHNVYQTVIAPIDLTAIGLSITYMFCSRQDTLSQENYDDVKRKIFPLVSSPLDSCNSTLQIFRLSRSLNINLLSHFPSLESYLTWCCPWIPSTCSSVEFDLTLFVFQVRTLNDCSKRDRQLRQKNEECQSANDWLSSI